MPISEPDKIITPWAETGSKNPIPPNADNTTGAAGFDKGFPDITMTPEEAGGLPPAGQDFNGILNSITAILRFFQGGGISSYSSSLSSAVSGYSKGALLIGDDKTSLYQSSVEGNTTNPNLGGAGWVKVFDYGSNGYNVITVDSPKFNGDLVAAYNSIPILGNSVLLLGNKTYNFLGVLSFVSKNEKQNVSFIGCGKPRYDAVSQRLVDGSGTVIQGSIFNSAKGLKVFNLGIDRGEYVRVNLAGGAYDDAFVNHTFGSDAGIQYGDIVVLESRSVPGVPASNTHCILNEIGSGVTQTGVVEVIDGYHGHVVKCRDFVGDTTVAKYQSADAAIIKSDAGAKCSNVSIKCILINGDSSRESAGILYEAQAQSLDNVKIGMVCGVNCRWLVDQAPSTTAPITDLLIGHAYGAVISGVGARQALVVGANTVGMTIGTHALNACVKGGVNVEAGAKVGDIGSGFSKGATQAGASGYKFSGECKHGNLSAGDNAGWGVENAGNKFLNAGSIFCAGNTLGGVSAIPVISAASQNGWSDPDGTFRAAIYGSTIRISGKLTGGSVGAAGDFVGVMKLSGDGLPAFDEYLSCTGYDASGAPKSLIAKIGADGIIRVYGMFVQAVIGIHICGGYVIQTNR